MKALAPLLIFALTTHYALSQEALLNVRGKILDAKTKEPLPNASIEIKHHPIDGVSGLADGAFEFRLPATSKSDSVEISHVGYKAFKKRVADIKSPEIILLEPYTTELKAVTITSRKLNLKDIDQSLRRIRGNLYAYET